MTVVDLHPEELLDKEARGALSSAESTLLEAHLARCATCRAEKLLRADFASELDEPMDDRTSLTDLLEGVAALRTKTPRDETPPGVDVPEHSQHPQRSERDERAPMSAPVPVPARRRRMSTAPAWFLVAAAMLAVSAATGATEMGKRAWTHVVAVVTTIDTASPATTTPATKAPKHAARATAAREAGGPPAPTEAPAPMAAMPEPIETVDTIAPAPAVTASPLARAATRPRAVAPPVPDADAAALFESAATARRQGDYGQAIALHRDLVARFPRTREAQTSRATVGRLLLDRGDPSGALASFDTYMTAGSGELGEEAMAGRATALERLGRSDDARRAWEALLAAYPSTPYAAHARARVGASEASGR